MIREIKKSKNQDYHDKNCLGCNTPKTGYIKVDGYAAVNPCHYGIEKFFTGIHDTYAENMPIIDKKLCEEYISENYPKYAYHCIPATVIYRLPDKEEILGKNIK